MVLTSQLQLGLNESLNVSGIIGPYGNFDDLYDHYREGAYGQPGDKAWESMVKRWSMRTEIALRAGATALDGDRYAKLSAQGIAEADQFDATQAENRRIAHAGRAALTAA